MIRLRSIRSSPAWSVDKAALHIYHPFRLTEAEPPVNIIRVMRAVFNFSRPRKNKGRLRSAEPPVFAALAVILHFTLEVVYLVLLADNGDDVALT